MKQTAIRYGMYALLGILFLSCIHFFILMDRLSYEQLEVIGWLTMGLSMIFVFFGIRYYRNEKNNGVLSFGQGLKVGVLIVLFPAIFFGLFDVLYVEVFNPGWLDDYYNYQRELLIKKTAADKLADKLKTMENQKEFFANPLFQFLVMSLTVFVMGFIVTIISALALRRKPAAVD
jgi:hypothetical protein